MKQDILLGVNIDHIASIRQSRKTRYPDPIHAAMLAEQAGADSITVHLREDRRHIQERDVRLLLEVMQTRMNLEMAVTGEMLSIAEKYRPADCCLVPERREELTTEGGLDVRGNKQKVKDACARLADAGIRVSLFIDAEPAQIEAAAEVGAPVIEIHTGHFADADTGTAEKQELKKIIHAVQAGKTCNLQVNAGHGLHYHNVQHIASIPDVAELNIGHAIIARALFVGFEEAVREMKRIMQTSRGII